MLRRELTPSAAEPPLQVVLTCGDRECQHTFEPDLVAFATGRLACPRCGGWTFHAELADPEAPAPGGERT